MFLCFYDVLRFSTPLKGELSAFPCKVLASSVWRSKDASIFCMACMASRLTLNPPLKPFPAVFQDGENTRHDPERGPENWFRNRNPKPETRNRPSDLTSNEQAETRNPKPETQKPEPETRKPEPETKTRKPKLKPETRNQNLPEKSETESDF